MCLFLIKIVPTRTIPLFFLLLFSIHAIPQQKTPIDSLKNLAGKGHSDTVRVKALNSLSRSHWKKKEFKAAREFAEKAEKLAKKSGYHLGQAKALKNLGIIQEEQGEYEKAIEFYKKGLSINQSIEDKEGIGSAYGNLANIHLFKGEYDQAVSYYIKALRIMREIGNKQKEGIILNSLGNVSLRMNNLEKAIEYYEEYGKVQKDLGNPAGISRYHHNLAGVLYKKKDLQKSYDHYKKGLSIMEQAGAPPSIMYSKWNNLGTIFLESFQSSIKKDSGGSPDKRILNYPPEELLDSAGYFFERTIPYAKKFNDRRTLTQSHLGLGTVKKERGELDIALDHFLQALDLAQKMGAQHRIFEAEKWIAEIYAEQGEYQKAYEHFRVYSNVRQKVYNEKSSEKVAEMEEKYKAEKHKRRAKVMEKKKEIAEEREKRKQSIIYSISGGLAIVLVLLGVLVNRFQLIRKQRNHIEEQKKEVDQAYGKLEETHDELQLKNKEITDSINYASLIQEAVLPSTEILEKNLEDHFILLKPQATVSGDFYWAHETKEGGLLWAAVDCTGHGVPGAFMSMIGTNLLEEMVGEKGYTEPGTILDKLREGIIRKIGYNDRKDGMDMALCHLKKNEKGEPLLEFAGANNPLYLIRKGIAEALPEPRILENGKEVDADTQRIQPFKGHSDGLEIKGNKQAVGLEEKEHQPFTTYQIPLQKGDALYIFSDGYADQFGGEKGKKFRYGPFKNTLVEHSQEPMAKQKEGLEKKFQEWKQGYEQIDDVLVIGCRI